MLKQDLALQILKKIDLPKGKIQKVIGLMKNELGGKIMKEFVGLRAKTYSYLKDNNDKDKKKQKAQKSVSYNENLNFKIIKTVQMQLKQKIK